MKPNSFRLVSISLLLLSTEVLSAQSSLTGSNVTTYLLMGLGLAIVAFAVLAMSDNLMQVEAHKMGSDSTKNNFSVFPKLSEVFGASKPAFVGQAAMHNLKKGHDIKLVGKAEPKIHTDIRAKTYAVKPTNFRGLSPIPRMLVAVGDEVKAGQALFEDKKDNRVKYVSPVSGEVAEIRRGQKRAITDVIILADRDVNHLEFEVPDISQASREELVTFLLNSGTWTMLNQRPYDVLPDPDIIPANIFISSFDSSPLAPDYSLFAEGKAASIQKAVDVLSKLTSGKVHIGLNASADSPSEIFTGITGAELNWFKGAHPAGNVGVQIHHTAPIGRTQKVWTLSVPALITLGDLFLTGKYNGERLIALTGSEFESPSYIKTYQGANIGDLVNGNLKGDNTRIIAGNVLTGQKTSVDNFLNVNDAHITAIPEGNSYELFGWMLPLTPRPSVSKTYPNFLFKNHEFEPTTNSQGERRAFVMTGQYEKLLPMDIHLQQLMKAILANDYERMEGLGINELSEEDVAICEFACTSKMPLQKILRQGLEMMREQG